MRTRPAVGERVGAILGAKNGIVEFLGFGEYLGDEVPPNTGTASMTGWLNEDGVPNPKIQLDNGDVVWGCECWWGPEEEIRRELSRYGTVNEVRIVDFRNGRK